MANTTTRSISERTTTRFYTRLERLCRESGVPLWYRDLRNPSEPLTLRDLSPRQREGLISVDVLLDPEA